VVNANNHVPMVAITVRRRTMGKIVEDRQLRGRRSVFRDRAEAGRALSKRLEGCRDNDALILAIPSGGLPVAAEMAKLLGLGLDVVIVRKLQVPLNPEAGFGAISMKGETILNQELLADLDLSPDQIEKAKQRALREGRSRERALRGRKTSPTIQGRTVILVDDGLATGYTMLAAIKEVRTEQASKIIVAVPTGSDRSVELVAEEVDVVLCLNVRGMPFAVADAYRNWYDLTEEQAADALRSVG
jgi:putative phosphoribosyl transferase